MFRNRKLQIEIPVLNEKSLSLQIRSTETSSENNSPLVVADVPQLNQYQRTSKKSRFVGMVLKQEDLFSLPGIEEKFISPKREKINPMPQHTLKELFTSPIRSPIQSKAQKTNEEGIKNLRLRKKRVNFQEEVKVLEYIKHQVITDTINNKKEMERSIQRRFHRHFPSDPTQISQYDDF